MFNDKSTSTVLKHVYAEGCEDYGRGWRPISVELKDDAVTIHGMASIVSYQGKLPEWVELFRLPEEAFPPERVIRKVASNTTDNSRSIGRLDVTDDGKVMLYCTNKLGLVWASCEITYRVNK